MLPDLCDPGLCGLGYDVCCPRPSPFAIPIFMLRELRGPPPAPSPRPARVVPASSPGRAMSTRPAMRCAASGPTAAIAQRPGAGRRRYAGVDNQNVPPRAAGFTVASHSDSVRAPPSSRHGRAPDRCIGLSSQQKTAEACRSASQRRWCAVDPSDSTQNCLFADRQSL